MPANTLFVCVLARCGCRRAESEQLSFLRRNQHAKQIQPGQTGLNWRNFRDHLAQFLESVRLTGAAPGTSDHDLLLSCPCCPGLLTGVSLSYLGKYSYHLFSQ